MILPIVLAAVGGLWYLISKNDLPLGTPGNLLPTPDNIPKVEQNAKPQVPSNVKGEPTKRKVKAQSGNDYTTNLWPKMSDGRQFVIVQLNGTTAWLSYYQNQDTTRKLVKAYAKGDRDQSGRVVSVMMSDFNVKK